MAKAKKSFETMIEELEQIVGEMESGELTLEESLKQYAAGVELLAACRSKLSAAAEVLQPQAEVEEGEEVHD